MVLDAASLEAIIQEIRTCFLYEDAPEHLAVLEQGIRQLHSPSQAATSLPDKYAVLMRAAHSLKGGAGIAQFPTLSALAHKLEDLFQELHQGNVQDRQTAHELLSLSVEQMSSLIAEATGDRQAFTEVTEGKTLNALIAALENFLQSLPKRTSLLPEGEAKAGLFSQSASTKAVASQGLRSLNLRMPVSRLDRMSNTIGELLISYERMALYQEQLHQVDLTLKKRIQQLKPLIEQVQTYQSSIPASGVNTGLDNNSGSSYFVKKQSSKGKKKVENVSATNSQSPPAVENYQELMVQVQETRADFELITDEFAETLALVKRQLDSLRWDLTESRLVKFGILAKQFMAAQQSFCQRYQKSVELTIIGKEIPIDQVVLEQLKVPLTHLFRNAFAHGIETAQERQELGKPTTAQITLSAAVVGNQTTVTVVDDGRGIDIQAVHQRAIQAGLCSQADVLTTEQILEFLYTPGFSTAATVTTLSGRGMGLDIVRRQVERIRGTVGVETQVGQGTKFTITIPLTLNILPLLLCRCQQQTWAIPSNQVIEIIALSEFGDFLPDVGEMMWRDRTVPIYHLTQLLPCSEQVSPTFSTFNQHLGIVLEVDSEIVVIAFDTLVGEKELVIKPFDTTVKVPTYLLGCTILGTGEAVPVLSPEYFGELVEQARQAIPNSDQLSSPKTKLGQAARILVVDDSITVRLSLTRLLSNYGYQVIQCKGAQEVLEKLNQPGEDFDLVISDIDMPHLDGLALLERIRSHPRWHNLAVVMLTARESEQYRQKALGLGAKAYITKPFHPDQLQAAIAFILT